MIYANFGVARPKNTKICDAIKVHVTFAYVVVARPKDTKICDAIKVHVTFANVVVARPKNTKICDAVKVHVTFANIVVARPQLLIHISPSKLQMYLIYFRVGICINNHQNLLSYGPITSPGSALSNASSRSAIARRPISRIKASW